MKIQTESHAYGRLSLSILRKGVVIPIYDKIPNLLLNGAFNNGYGGFYITNLSVSFFAHTSTAANYQDVDATWSQSGNTVTRATGSGTFPSSPSQIGNELLWETGERCHVTARASDTSITVSGPARTITGKKLRRFLTNVSATSGSSQSKSASDDAAITDITAGTLSRRFFATFDSATSAYTLGSIGVYNAANAKDVARIVLPSTVSIEVDDQIQLEYFMYYSIPNAQRNQTYELGAEASGVPSAFAMTSIVGSGTSVDVTFSTATNFLAGDKLDLRTVTPKKFNISSASSTSTTMTINTATAHGLNPGDSVTIAGASLAGYNGVFTAATASGTVLTITDSANPGAMGASGTVRLTTPATYFDDLGLATIASMVSSSVARITSAITGPAVEPVNITGDPGVNLTVFGGMQEFIFASDGSQTPFLFSDTNAKAIPAYNSTATISTTGGVAPNVKAYTASPGTYSNDWTCAFLLTWNAGAGSNVSRIKQVMSQYTPASYPSYLLTFNTPVEKTVSQRFRVNFTMKTTRELLPSTFP